MQEAVLQRVQDLNPFADEAGLSMAAFAVAGVLQKADVLAWIDAILEPVIERDPGKVESRVTRP